MPSDNPRRWENEQTPLNKVIARAEQTVAEAGSDVQVAFIMRSGNTITIRDNSGSEGLTGQKLHDATVAVLKELFPHVRF